MYGITYSAVLPVDEPVAWTDVADHLRIGPGERVMSNEREKYIAAAREMAERHTGRLFAPRTATLSLPRFPPGLEPVRLPVEPVHHVSAVRYRGADGTMTAMADGEYQTALSFSPPLVAPAAATTWPDTQAGALVGAEIVVLCGPHAWFAAPPAVKQAIRLAVGYWYAHRGDGGDPEKMGLPPAARHLLDLLDTGEP